MDILGYLGIFLDSRFPDASAGRTLKSQLDPSLNAPNSSQGAVAVVYIHTNVGDWMAKQEIILFRVVLSCVVYV